MVEWNKDFDNSLKKIVGSAAIVFVGIFLSKILTYVYRIIVARVFGTEVYGLYSLTLMVSGWFIALAGLGLGVGLIRFLPRYIGENQEGKVKILFRKSAKLVLITGLISTIGLVILAEKISVGIFHEPALTIFLRFFALIIPVSGLLAISLATLKGHERITPHIFLSDFLLNFLKVLILATFILLGVGLNAIIISYLAGTALTAIISLSLCKRCFPKLFVKLTPREKSNKQIMKQVFSFSWPLLFVGIIWKLFNWTDLLLIGYFSSATNVGIYNAAVPIAFLLLMAPRLFLQLFFPLINKKYSQKKKEEVGQLSKQIGKWTLILNLPLFIVLFSFPNFFINLLFGGEFLQAAPSLRYLSVGMLMFSIATISQDLIHMSGKSKLVFVDAIFIATLNFFLNLYLIPVYGIDGAAIATSVSLVVLSIIFIVQSKRLVSIAPLRKKMLNALFAAFIAFSLTWSLSLKFMASPNELFLIAVMILTYLFSLLILKSLDRNDKMIIEAIVDKLTGKKLSL